jgi:hypothetical protein
MVEPVSLGLAAAVLLASKFGEGLAKDAGSSSWRAITGLRELIAHKLGRGRETPAALVELETDPSPPNLVAAGEVIDAAARTDPAFAAALRQLVDTARQNHTVEVFVAHAYDQAKQVNIRGDNHGPITMS